MPELYFIKAAQAKPFVDTLKRLGAPVELLARQADMPLDAIMQRSGVIGERSLWRFIAFGAKSVNQEFLGYKTAVEHPVTDVADLGGLALRLAPTLESIFEFFIKDVRTEANGADYSLRDDGDNVWFHRKPIFPDSDASWQAEQYVVSFIIQIVRMCANPGWLPAKIRIASHSLLVPVPPEWSTITFEWGNPATEICIERATMSLPPRLSRTVVKKKVDGDSGSSTLQNFSGLVDRQIWSGTIGIDNAANELGISTTTLKRRLLELGTSYLEIVKQRRHTWACQMLSGSNKPISEIARDLGYRHRPNFARAFTRLSGISPATYRQRTR